MTETIQINWLLLAGPLLWSLGFAVLVALLGLMEFLKAAKKTKRRDFLAKPLCKTGIAAAIVLIVCGFLLNFVKIPIDQFIAVKLEKQKPGPEKIIPTASPMPFLPKTLQMDSHNKSHILNNEKMRDNTMILFWDGYIQTPLLQLKKGNYIFQFQAKGSRAKDEFSRIKIEFESLDKNNYLVTNSIKYIELTGRMQAYHLDFHTTGPATGRIRITYFNDLYIPESKTGRDVWVREVILMKNGK